MSAVAEPFAIVRFDIGDLFLVDRTVQKSIVDSSADAAAALELSISCCVCFRATVIIQMETTDRSSSLSLGAKGIGSHASC